MANDIEVPALRERIEKLEARLGRNNRYALVLALVSLLVVGAGLYHFGFRFASRTLVAHKVVLTAPDGRVLGVLGVDNEWDKGFQTKDFYAGLEFRDGKGERKMKLFGTGLFLFEGGQHVSLDFTGLQVTHKEGQIWLTPKMFSFAGDKGRLTLYPHPSGLDLSITSDEGNEFGVVTDHDEASLYVTSTTWETDLIADKTGTRFVRARKRAPPQ
jgi:hypothetical protein